jgi:Ca2+-transporting ATPase
MEEIWYLKSIDDTVTTLQTSRHGLTGHEAKKRRGNIGKNTLSVSTDHSLWIVFFRQLLTPFTLILGIAAGIKFAVSNYIDAIVLMVTILLIILVSFVQEMKAENALRLLKRFACHKSRVKRDGKLQIIESENLVLGDLVLLEMGDQVPADGRVVEAANFKINESMLTGESVPTEKMTNPLEGNPILADRKNMAYSGTVVTYGKGAVLVTAIGDRTELGKIASTIESIESQSSHLQKNIASIGNWMILIITVSVLGFVWLSYYKGMALLDVFLLAVAAAVSAIPEGLPAAFTMTLAGGMRIMARKNAIIRKMTAVETLGATTLICSDKTGTLTCNQMTATVLYSLSGTKYPLDAPVDIERETVLRKMLEIGVLCNDSSVTYDGANYSILGDPTEGALKVAATRAGIDSAELERQWPRIEEIPFISENLYMATLHSTKDKRWICVKGAPEKVLSMSSSVLTPSGSESMQEHHRQQISEAMGAFTNDALRLIAVAYLEIGLHERLPDPAHFGQNLVFTGIFGLLDPPRKEAIEAIASCKKAGIRVIMITGDNPKTAAAIACKLGIHSDLVTTGKELQELSDEELKCRLQISSVYARVEPSHKLRIVRALQNLGHIVAMTGDGVNDAPALEAANIGIAMGVSGTDVAKEASDMILSDDRFDSIVAAIEEGRAIFSRLRNICSLQITACIGELIGYLLCVLFIGMPPLIPLQIIWINLVSGSLIAIPLGFEPKTGLEMSFPPRDPKSGLVYPGMIYRIITLATLLGVGIFFTFNYSFHSLSLEKARTITLSSLILFEWLIALHMRSDDIPIRKIGIFKNKPLLAAIAFAAALQLCILYIPGLSKLFNTGPLSLLEWSIALIPGLFIFLLETLRKEFFPNLFSTGKWKKSRY